MALAVRVHFRSQDGALQGERIINNFPVRLGRNPMNDCALAHPFVSDFHAQIELIDGEISVRDLNSRNGVFDRTGGRLPSGRSIPMASLGNVFVVGRAVRVEVETFEDERDIGSRSSMVFGSVLGNRAAMGDPGGAHRSPAGGRAESAFGPPPHLGWGSGVAPLPPLSRVEASPLERPPPRAASNPVPASLAPSLAPLPPLAPYSFAASPDPSPYVPQAPRASDVRPVHGPGHGDLNRNTQHLAMNTEMLALQGLRELASSLVPGASLETTGEVARLLTKIHDLVAVFCRCFVPLRDARIGDVRGRRRVAGSPSASTVERAADPAALAAVLLDWRNHDYDAPDAVESILLDIISQQTAMVEGTIRGIEALLQEISPEALERAATDEAGAAAVFGRHRALWAAFKKRFEDLSDESRQLEIVFGRDVATWYRERIGKTKP